jgi:hypothetical protein
MGRSERLRKKAFGLKAEELLLPYGFDDYALVASGFGSS